MQPCAGQALQTGALGELQPRQRLFIRAQAAAAVASPSRLHLGEHEHLAVGCDQVDLAVTCADIPVDQLEAQPLQMRGGELLAATPERATRVRASLRRLGGPAGIVPAGVVAGLIHDLAFAIERMAMVWIAWDGSVHWPRYDLDMCRNIRTLHNFEPPANEQEVRAAALQYVRKISGFTRPSQVNTDAFERAVDAVALVSTELLDALVNSAPPKDREVEAAKARARTAARFAA